MKKELIGFLPEPSGKPKNDDRQVAGIASLAPSLQQQQPPPATSLQLWYGRSRSDAGIHRGRAERAGAQTERCDLCRPGARE